MATVQAYTPPGRTAWSRSGASRAQSVLLHPLPPRRLLNASPTVKSFSTLPDAQLFLAGKDPSLDPASSSYTAKFYGVRCGKVPGVYTDWASAELQVKGVQKPKVKYAPSFPGECGRSRF